MMQGMPIRKDCLSLQTRNGSVQHEKFAKDVMKEKI